MSLKKVRKDSVQRSQLMIGMREDMLMAIERLGVDEDREPSNMARVLIREALAARGVIVMPFATVAQKNGGSTCKA